MVASTVAKVRTANLPYFRLSPKEATYLLTVIGIANFVFGMFIGFML